MATSRKEGDRKLGMGSPISRRDFLNGVAVTVGASLLGSVTDMAPFASPQNAMAAALRSEKGADSSAREYFLSQGITQENSQYCPPGLDDRMRGQHPGSFEAVHLLRDHDFRKNADKITDTGER